MTRRTLAPPPVAESRAGDRMAPGGRLWSESPIRAFRRPVKQAGVTVVPEILPQFWWKFDEASGLFHDYVADAASLTGGGFASYQFPPLAPDSIYSARTAATIQSSGMTIPAVTPGPGGWVVFDWWVSNLDMTLTGAQVDARVTYFESVGSFDGVNFTPLQIRFAALLPGVMTKTLRFVIGPHDAFSPECVLALTGWDNPAHFRWKINPAADLWQIWMGDTLMGSGSQTIIWGGLWQVRFSGVVVGAGWDEFKVYGE